MENAAMPLISVVMPNYNGERFLAETIRTVLNQSCGNLELIIVDDYSTDGSCELISRFREEDDRVWLIKNELDHGVAFARNTGIHKARGKYIALIDNDDTWEPEKLERQLALAENGADIVYCSYDFVDESGNTIKRPFIVPERTSFAAMLKVNAISSSTAFIKAELLKEHPFSAEHYHEDYVLWMELLKLSATTAGDKKVLMHYRQVRGSRSNKKRNAAKERWNAYRKALKLSLPVSIYAFICYSIKGAIKYYF